MNTRMETYYYDAVSAAGFLTTQWRPSLQSATVSRLAKSRAPEDLAELYKAFKKWELAKYPPTGVKIKPKGVIRIK